LNWSPISAMSLEPMSIVVRNTFIDAVEDQDGQHDDSPLHRTKSDPTGGRAKQVLNLDRILPRRIKEEEEEQEQEPEGAEVKASTTSAEPKTMCDKTLEEEEDEEDSPLARTKSVSAPVFADLGRTLSQLSAVSAASGEASLQRLLTGGGEDETFASAMPPPYGYPGVLPPLPPHLMPWGMYPPPLGNPEMWASMMNTYKDGLNQEQTSAASGRTTEEAEKMPSNVSLPLGNKHSFHQETKGMGIVRPDFRQFTKVGFEGRLSVVSESQVHQDGLHRYVVQFTAGELSRADGVGFVFSQRLPCAKNIQRIVSIFVNQRGRICMRAFSEIERAEAFIKPLEVGDCVEMAVDLTQQVCTFNVWPAWSVVNWPATMGRPVSTAEFSFGSRMAALSQAAEKTVKLNVGHLACVVKNVGVTITLYS